MFIRRTRTRSNAEYFTFRLVRSERIGDKVRQRTLLNLGRHFEVAQSHWPMLCRRIDELLTGQLPLPPDCPATLEAHAQRITAALLAGERIGAPSSLAGQGHDFQHVDVDSLELLRPRSVGVEHVGLWAMSQLALPTVLEQLGIGASLRAAAIGSILARMARPGSERATGRWLGFRSLKSELGLRPIYHHKPIRAEGHLFITVIAYQLVQVIRTRLREAGHNASWSTLRRSLEGQQRITATFRRADGRTLHVRKATRAEPPQLAIYDALGIQHAPGGTRKTVV